MLNKESLEELNASREEGSALPMHLWIIEDDEDGVYDPFLDPVLEEEEDWADDVCCFDPMYKGPPGSCHCKDYAESVEYNPVWYIRLWESILGGWNTCYFWLKRIIPYWLKKPVWTNCIECQKKYNYRRYFHTCPHCGYEDLPF